MEIVSPEQIVIQEAIVNAMTPIILVGTLIFSVVYVVLAVVQWRRMTWVVPAIMLAFLGYGILNAVGGILMFGSWMAEQFTFASALMWLVNIASIIMYAAAFLGGRVLEKLKRTY